MATITTPVKGFTGAVAGVTFADGKGETDEPGAIQYFKRHGYTVEGDQADEPAFPEGDPTDKWKVDHLKAYAAAKEIDLGDASKKPEILAAIEAAKQPNGETPSDTSGE